MTRPNQLETVEGIPTSLAQRYSLLKKSHGGYSEAVNLISFEFVEKQSYSIAKCGCGLEF